MKLSMLIAELSVAIGAGYLLGYKAGKLQGLENHLNEITAGFHSTLKLSVISLR